MGGQGLNPLSLGGSDNVGAEESESSTTDEASINDGGAEIHATSGQTIGDSSVTTVQFDTADSDYTPGDVLTTDLPNNKITIEQNGRYVIEGSSGFSTPGDGTNVIIRLKVGGTVRTNPSLTAGSNDNTKPQTFLVEEITNAPTDVILEIFQDSGGNLVTSGNQQSDHLSIGRIG